MSIAMRTYNSREEWLNARQSRIGGSDAGAIMGLNPYMSNVDLWEIKTGRKSKADLSNNKFVQFGHDAEPLMREMFKLDFPEFTCYYMDNNMWLNDEFPFAHASLDGWLKCDEGSGILEIKTVNVQNSTQLKEWNNRIPNTYYCQVLHYFMVTGFDFAILKARLKWESNDSKGVYCQIRHYSIERKDCISDIEALADAEKKFMWNIKHDVRPDLILPQI